MNKVFQMLLLLVVAISLLFLGKAILPVIIKSDNTLDTQIIVSTELKNISQADIDGVKKEAREALKSIPPILGIEYKKAIEIKIVDKGGIFNAIGGIVSLSISHTRDKSAPVIHEVTHVLTKHKYNSFFSEGLAVYFQERFGGYQTFPNFSAPLDDLMKNNQDRLIHITKLIDDNGIFGQVETERRKIAYIEAGSFINFLVIKYGEQKLADLHNSSSLNYKKVYGKGIKELEVEWKDYVLGNPT